MFRLKLALRSVIVVALAGAILFGAAGRVDLPAFWIYLVLLGAFVLGAVLGVTPELLAERFQPAGAGHDSLACLRLAAVLVFVSELVLAGLDVGRWRGSAVPPAVQALAFVGLGTFLAVWTWSMRTNPFFSAAVRVQHERGHRVVSTGPYALVRHPGYAAFVLLGACAPLALGSWWATLPHLVVVALFVRRARLEDRVLQAELPGYSAYARRVRYRFLPGIW
ncbi:MAG TPA: isoprenylcysteine carboxylmethyltransferase family protein [Candidatus Polarisedimenticolaceae bacterium]|nr:isoprenylcysteine carboxylmethyltransferase family protein [Candidatus Polarisedimenticolaceae bacterium]